jgi:hypothetical protein
VESDADRFNVFKLLLALKRLGLVGVAGEIAAVAGVEEEEDYAQQEAVPFLDPVEAEEDGDGEQEIERDPLLVETTPKRASEQIVFRDALAEETRPAAMTVPEVSRPGGTWRIPLLLLATIAILAAAAYIAGVLRPGTAPSPNARTARSPLAAVPAPPPIIIEATPIPSVEAEPTPMLTTLAVSVATPLPALASPSPPPSPRPLPTPVPTAGAVIIAKLHTPAPSAEPAVEEPSEDPERARLDGMAAEFAGSNRPRYSVQFGIFCKTSSIANALQADPANVWFVPAIFRGERCYRAYWGRFEERAAVEQAISRLPEALRDGTRPTIASFGSE